MAKGDLLRNYFISARTNKKQGTQLEINNLPGTGCIYSRVDIFNNQM